MNILFVGDIFASPGRRIAADHLQDIKATNNIDIAIANAAETAGQLRRHTVHIRRIVGNGVRRVDLRQSHRDKKEIYDYLSRQPKLLRPANYPAIRRAAGWSWFPAALAAVRSRQPAGAHLHAGHRLPVPKG